MSAEVAVRGTVYALMLGAGALLHAAELEQPDLEFIEYLGMWEESDEDWQMMEAKVAENLEEQEDDPLQDEVSVEDDEES